MVEVGREPLREQRLSPPRNCSAHDRLPGGRLLLARGVRQIAAGNPRRAARSQIDFDDLIPDHDHLMHFFLIRTPGDG